MTERKPDNVRPLIYVLFKKYGLAGAWQIFKEDVLFDLVNRVDTVRAVSNRKLFSESLARTQNRYVPSTFSAINSAMQFLDTHISLSDTGFVDLGSGKAKAVIAASQWPFKSVRGIEISESLHATACDNVRRLNLDDRIDLQNGNAINVTLEDHERIIFLFNPFIGDTLEQCLSHIKAQNKACWIVYMNPTEDHIYQRYFTKIAHQFFNPGRVEVCFYKSE